MSSVTATVACFFYTVRGIGSAWVVTADGTQARFAYPTRELAEGVARGAARRRWETRGEPSGVRVEDGRGNSEIVVRHGP